ncbi:MAG: hypothetical protein ACYS7Y_19080 [Planctomycetota bacterium]|jgi:hypothetical protein
MPAIDEEVFRERATYWAEMKRQREAGPPDYFLQGEMENCDPDCTGVPPAEQVANAVEAAGFLCPECRSDAIALDCRSGEYNCECGHWFYKPHVSYPLKGITFTIKDAEVSEEFQKLRDKMWAHYVETGEMPRVPQPGRTDEPS